MLEAKAKVSVTESPYFYSSCPAHLTSPRWLATVHHFEGGFDRNERFLGASAHQGRTEILQVPAVYSERPSGAAFFTLPCATWAMHAAFRPADAENLSR